MVGNMVVIPMAVDLKIIAARVILYGFGIVDLVVLVSMCCKNLVRGTCFGWMIQTCALNARTSGL